ncbi:4'-phosphopantetheinyl transferase family protein [Agrilutibacter solisilvae]|uniref:4'-phosphopantetheinyl transferase superfamily protein n=1 Tax=Agrilutibacter solisilvae TaxID=2763317 RepID=A0A974Y625_9GAMM|nr:4'-phosphopantetheinyl transferase superfamily protein [Lysobacter solisilvae]QSX79276.1 4'-phosphopantetheinyl transferase superfamily protein [Lysobacter solisilvae]
MPLRPDPPVSTAPAPPALPVGPLRWSWHPHRRGEPAEPAARDWLAGQLGHSPDTLPLQRDARGRPHLLSAGIDCSWSHSGEGLLVVLAQGVIVGADCERLHARPRALALARRFFTAPEHDWLAAQPAGEPRDRAFLRLWCAKESVLKAHGHGLSFGLERLRFEVQGERLRLIECDPELGDAAAWTLHELEPAAGYVAALAWRG